MPRLRVHNFSLSLDGYGAGPDQNVDNPIGVGGSRMHDWLFATRTFNQRFGTEGGGTGLDDDFVIAAGVNIGATIMGRNMFGPIRGPWPNDDWKGWWGDEPPFHHQVFVLTHHSRASFSQGETTFHFTSDPIEQVLGRAFEAADGQDVCLGGGVATIQQFLRAALIDELQLATVPLILGSGEPLFASLGPLPDYRVSQFVASPSVLHTTLTKTG
jgi:dihydrofolate reductase